MAKHTVYPPPPPTPQNPNSRIVQHAHPFTEYTFAFNPHTHTTYTIDGLHT